MDNLENSDKNISLPFEEDESIEEIEVLDDPKRSAKEVLKDTASIVQKKASEIQNKIDNEDIYESSKDVPIINEKGIKIKKLDKILKIQIALVIIWVVLTLSIYLFGYDLFEPIIPIS